MRVKKLTSGNLIVGLEIIPPGVWFNVSEEQFAAFNPDLIPSLEIEGEPRADSPPPKKEEEPQAKRGRGRPRKG